MIMVFFSLFIVGVTYLFSLALGFEGPSALGLSGIFLIVSGLINLASYYWSDKVVMTLSGAKSISKEDNPKLFRTVENLTIGAGLPMPKIYIIDDLAPNAFATGRDPHHSAVALTSGLLDKLENLELEGVIAHELSHIKNYDTRLMTIVVVLVGLVATLSDLFFRASYSRSSNRKAGALILVVAILAAILAPIVAQLIKLSISRRREFLADASGALLTRYPDGLASALEKIASDSSQVRLATTATAHLYISSPFKNQKGTSWLTRLFMTHPPIEERIKALRAM